MPILYDRNAGEMTIPSKDGLTIYKGPIVPVGDALRKIALGVVVMEADLSGADMQGCDLDELVFIRCDLKGADLRRSTARGTAFLHCDLAGVTAFALEAPRSDFSETDLGELDGRKADFTGANLRRAKFQACGLKGTVLDKTDLSFGRLTNSNLRGASFRDANMACADFRHSKVRGCDLRGADLRNDQPLHLRRSKGQIDRTFGVSAVGNRYASGIGELWRRVTGRDRLDETVGAFASDRMTQLLTSTAAVAVSTGATALGFYWAEHRFEMDVAHMLGTGMVAMVATKALGFVKEKAQELVKEGLKEGLDPLGNFVRPAIQSAVARGRNIRDLLVVCGMGTGAREVMRKAFAATPDGGESAATGAFAGTLGNVEVVVCDKERLGRALSWLEDVARKPDGFSHDVLLVREAEGSGPRALKFHAGGGMTAIGRDPDTGELTNRTWPEDLVKSRSVLEENVLGRYSPQRKASALACAQARETFARGMIEDLYGPMPGDLDMSKASVWLDRDGQVGVKRDDGPSWVVSPENDDGLFAEGATFRV